jgi:hypothetical protein
VLVIFAMASLSSAFDLSPSQANPGDKITLTGTASPGELLSFSSSFSMNLPVTGGQYSYETSVVVPQTPNRFSVTARNVQDLNAGVKLVIWITKRFEAQGGTVSLSQANVPQGQYNLKVFGQAQEGASTVPVDVTAETGVKADENGAYSLVIDTSGIPSGEYRIEGAGETKTIPIGVYRAVETRTQDTSQPELAQSNAPQTAVTPAQEPSAPSQPERVAETKLPEQDIISKLRSIFGI